MGVLFGNFIIQRNLFHRSMCNKLKSWEKSSWEINVKIYEGLNFPDCFMWADLNLLRAWLALWKHKDLFLLKYLQNKVLKDLASRCFCSCFQVHTISMHVFRLFKLGLFNSDSLFMPQNSWKHSKWDQYSELSSGHPSGNFCFNLYPAFNNASEF